MSIISITENSWKVTSCNKIYKRITPQQCKAKKTILISGQKTKQIIQFQIYTAYHSSINKFDGLRVVFFFLGKFLDTFSRLFKRLCPFVRTPVQISLKKNQSTICKLNEKYWERIHCMLFPLHLDCSKSCWSLPLSWSGSTRLFRGLKKREWRTHTKKY